MSRKRHTPELPWASFADALSGMLFIFVITSFWFAIQLNQAKAKTEETTKVITSALDEAKSLTAENGPLVKCLESDTEPGAKLEAAPQANEARVSLYLPAAVPWFETNSATLGGSQKQAATRVGACILSIVGLAQTKGYKALIYLEGHTDNVPMKGEELGGESNWELSGRRAAAVVRELLSDRGLAEAIGRNDLRIMAVGMAYLKPAWQRLCEDKGPHWSDGDDEVCAALKNVDTPDYAPMKNIPLCTKQARPRVDSEWLIHWANRCPNDGNKAERRRALLRRVDLRIELLPILKQTE